MGFNMKQLDNASHNSRHYQQSNTILTAAEIQIENIEELVFKAFNGVRSLLQVEYREDGPCRRVFTLSLDNGTDILMHVLPPTTIFDSPTKSDILDTILDHFPDIPVPKRLLRHGITSRYANMRCLLTTSLYGATLSNARCHLPSDIIRSIDYQVGQLSRQISKLRSSYFGFPGLEVKKKYATWKDAFLSLFESILRDAENLFISIPYEALRWHISRLSFTLDNVTTAQLVCYDVDDASILVDVETRKVSGIWNAERAAWGDPLMNASFKNPTAAFLSGFGGNPLDAPGAATRVLLYTVLSYLRSVVEVYYQHLDQEAEAKARKGLVMSLGHLANLKIHQQAKIHSSERTI